MFRNFPKLKFKGKGCEAADLRRLVNKYAEWAHILVPNMEFSDFVEKLEKLSGNNRVRTKLELIRNVVQGICREEDIDDYEIELQDRAERAAAEGEQWDGAALGEMDGHSEWGDEIDAAMAVAPAPAPVVLDDDQRERMERNKRLALERAAARKAAASASTDGSAPVSFSARPPQPAEEDDEDMAAAWAEESAEVGGNLDATGFDAFDEEAEAELFGDLGAPIAIPPAPAPRTQIEFMDDSEPGATPMDAAAAAAQQAREQAQAAAAALEAGLDDDEEF